MRGFLSIVAVSAGLLCCGCLALPNLAKPGDEEHQQARAQLHEPYPDNDIGPPIVGGRPREYQDPRPEVTRELQQSSTPIVPACPPVTYPPMACPQAPMAQPEISMPPPAIYNPPTASPQ